MKNLKSILTIAVLSTATIFTSCKKKEDTPAPTTTPLQVSIIGTWNQTEAYTPDNNNNYTVPLCPLGCGPSSITFSANNTYNSSRRYADMGIPGSNVVDNGTYTNSDSLIITSTVTGRIVRAKIYKLETNALWFRYNANSYYELRFTK
jgi:hypothetical protein